MSRQSKQKRTIALRQQVTAAHKGSVASTVQKRAMQPVNSRARMGFTTKLTSARKGKMGIKQQHGE